MATRDGEEPKAVSRKFGRSIERSASLFETDNPVDLEQVRRSDQMRGRGKRNSA